MVQMKKVEEDINIKATENVVSRNNIKDIDISLDTGASHQAIAETKDIKARLDSLIISSSKPCEILITFLGFPDIVVYHKMDFSGKPQYIPIRLQTFDPSTELLVSGFSSFILNNKLKIMIDGQLNTKVDLTLRLI